MSEPGGRIAAYRCPSCGAGVMSAVDVTALASGASGGGRIRLRCGDPECPSSAMENPPAMEAEGFYGSDGQPKLRLSVPCIFCGRPHVFTVDKSAAASRDCLVFPCPASGIDICFVGQTDYVKAGLAKSELELLDMIGDDGDLADVAGFSVDSSKMLPDPEIEETIRLTVRFLEDDGKIVCKCRPEDLEKIPEGESRITVEPGPRYVKVACRECGAAKIIPAVSHSAAQDFADSDRLVLE